MTKPDARTAERLAAAFPSRRADVEWDLVDGRAAVAIPKRYGAVERFLSRFFPGPDVVFLTFDELGTEGWLLADGTRSVAQVAEGLREKFGERADPARERAMAFFADLARRGLVRLTDAPYPVAGESRGFTPGRGYRDLACRRCGARHPIRGAPGARYQCPRCRAVNRVPAA